MDLFKLPNMNILKIFSVVVLCVVILSSCRDDYNICTENRFVSVNGSFYRVVGGVPTKSTVSNYFLGTIGGNAVVNNVANASSFATELNPTQDSTVYIIRLNNSGFTDTLTYRHTSRTETISAECGNITAYTLTSVKTTKNYIDSIVILNNSISRFFAENVKIYYR